MKDKQLCNKANKIVEYVNKWSKENIMKDLFKDETHLNVFKHKLSNDLHEIFLTGSWYGAYMVYKLNDDKKDLI